MNTTLKIAVSCLFTITCLSVHADFLGTEMGNAKAKRLPQVLLADQAHKTQAQP